MIIHVDRFDTKCSQIHRLLHELKGEHSRTKSGLETTKTTLHEKESELQECREQILRSISTFQVSDSCILNSLIMIRDSLCDLISTLPDITDFDLTWPCVHSIMTKNFACDLRVNLRPGVLLDDIQTEIMQHDIFYLVWKILLEPTLAGASHSQRQLLSKILEQMKVLEPIKGEYSRIEQDILC